MNATLGLLDGIPGSGDGGGGGGGGPSGGSILTVSKDREIDHNNHDMSIEDSSPYPIDDDDDDGGDDDLELGLGLGIGGGLKIKEEASRIMTAKEFPSLMSSCSSSSSSSSVNIPNSSIAGTKRTAIDYLSPPNGTSVVGWPPIRRAHRIPILANRIKSAHEELGKKITNGHYLSVKVNMDGTLIGRKVDLYAHTSYEMLAQTLENMFYGIRSSTEAAGSSRLLNGTSEFVLTYEDKDGDCMLVGDVPWQMFLSSVKRLRILRNATTRH